MSGLADWNWKRLDDSIVAPRDDDQTLSPQERLARLIKNVREIIRSLNTNMKNLENSAQISGKQLTAIGTFANGATTPNISEASVWKTNNSAVTTITNFLGAEPGRVFDLVTIDANTTIKNNATIITKTGADRVLAAGSVTRFVTTDGAVWRESPKG